MSKWDLLIIAGIATIIIVALFLASLSICYTIASSNPITKVININGSDIIFEDDDFYIVTPDSERIKLGISDNEVLDLTVHSEILVKFKRYPSWGLYDGSEWFVDGIVKKP